MMLRSVPNRASLNPSRSQASTVEHPQYRCSDACGAEAALRQLVELVPIIESLAHKFAPKPTDQLRDEQE